METNSLSQLSNNKVILIPSYTGQFLMGSTYYLSVDEPKPEFLNSESLVNFNGDYDSIKEAMEDQDYISISIIPITEIEDFFEHLKKIFTEQIQWSIQNNHIGDDTFYDDLPDLYSMLQYAAYGIIHSTSSNEIPIESLMKPIDDHIAKLDQVFTDEDLLRDFCSKLSEEEFFKLNSNLVQERL